jgi:hypothetical protein
MTWDTNLLLAFESREEGHETPEPPKIALGGEQKRNFGRSMFRPNVEALCVKWRLDGPLMQ